MARRQVLAIALAAALLALLALRLPGAPARGQPTATPAPAPPSAPPVYVLGPQPLVEAVERAGLNAVPITTADLSKIPNGSVVVVDWAQLETARGAPNLAGPQLETVRGTLNFASPTVQALEGIFARGGLVLVNSSDPVAAELLLSYAAARAAGVKFGDHYLAAALVLPGGGTLVGAAVLGNGKTTALLVGPIRPDRLAYVAANWARLKSADNRPAATAMADPPINQDPCYATYVQARWGGLGNNIFLWGMQILGSQGAPTSDNYGVVAVEDNYGDIFFYDSCILMMNSVLVPNPPQILAALMGDVAYYMTPSGGNEVYIGGGVSSQGPGALEELIGGFDAYASYQAMLNGSTNAFVAAPLSFSYQPDSSFIPVGSFTIDIGLKGLSVTYESELIGGPYISVSQSPWTSTTIGGNYAFNATWTFIYSGLYDISNPTDVIDGFIVGPDQGAVIVLANRSPGDTYWLWLPFNAEVMTTCWSAWARADWLVGLIPQSNGSVAINTATLDLVLQEPTPNGSWISGYAIYGGPPYCPISLSGPSLQPIIPSEGTQGPLFDRR
ncbi:MAG: hypothetical protein RXR06_05505 [Thermoproteus sp.]